MAKTFGTYPAPDPLLVSAGVALVEAGESPTGEALNWLKAYYGRRDLVVAGFPTLGGGDVPMTGYQATESATAYPASPCAAWAIPPIPGMTSVKVVCEVAAEAALDGWIEVVSIIGGDTQSTHAVTAGRKTLTLAVDVSGGYDIVEIRLKADSAGKVISLWGVTIQPDVLTSPLASGVAGDGFVGVDAAEMDANEPLSSDLMDTMRTDLGCIRDTPQSYYQYSTWRHDGAGTAKDVRMPACPHVAVCPVWVGSWRDGYTVTVMVRAQGAAGTDTYVVVYAGDTYRPRGRQVATITIPAAAAEAWYSTTIRLPQGRRVATGMPPGWDSVFLCVWPDGSAAVPSDLPRELGVASGDITTTYALLSVSAWGK